MSITDGACLAADEVRERIRRQAGAGAAERMVPMQAGDTEALGRAQLLKASLSGQLGNTGPLLQVGPSVAVCTAGCFLLIWVYSAITSLCQHLCLLHMLKLAGQKLQPRYFDHAPVAQLPSL